MPHADQSLQGLCHVPQGLAAFTLGINWNGLRPSAADFEFHCLFSSSILPRVQFPPLLMSFSWGFQVATVLHCAFSQY